MYGNNFSKEAFMKRIALVFLMAASATALFATGVAEAPGSADMTGPEWTRGRTGFDGGFAPPADAVFTSIELTGTVEMMDDHAVLTADGKTYLLAIPRIAWYADDVADGTVITVSGNLGDGEILAVGSMGGRDDLGRQQMPRGRQAMPQGRRI